MAVRLVAGSVLACGLAPVQAHAAMLGQARGTLVLGRAPVLVIPVRMDPGLPLVAECVSADMADGQAPVAPGSLRLSVHDGGAGRESTIELRGTQPLRAPFVQLTVRMQCQFRQSRTYTLLVDPPTFAQTQLASEQSAAASAPRPVHARHHETRRKARRTRHAGVAVARRIEPPRRALPSARGEHFAPGEHAQAPRVATSRLRLDWLSRDLAEGGGVAPGALGPAASRGLAKASSAPAGVASQAQPSLASEAQMQQMQQRDAQLTQRLDSMQHAVHALQASNAERERELGALRLELAQAKSGPPRWHNAALGGLAGLCALLGLLLWQSRRPRLESPWPAGQVAQAQATRGATRPATVAAVAVPGAPDSGPSSLLPFDREAFHRPLSVPEHVQIDEVVDHGHLADFFIGIGDYDKAIEVMRRAIDEAAGGASALPYLYLFDLYRRCDRRDEYERLLREREGRLNVRIPRWDELPEQAPRDLLDYPRALTLLKESWNTPACLTVIERLIADDPHKPRVGFDLPAYRDLLDLYAMARDLQRSERVDGSDLDLPLALEPVGDIAAGAAGARAQAPRAARAESAAGEVATLPPLDFTMPTRPPAAWGH